MSFLQSAPMTQVTKKPSCTILDLAHGNRPVTIRMVTVIWLTTIYSTFPRHNLIS